MQNQINMGKLLVLSHMIAMLDAGRLLAQRKNLIMAGSRTGNRNKPDFEVISKTHITLEKGDCICPLGQFWYWRNQQCISQGGWGYECGFFPEEHQNRVCRDGLKCFTAKQTAESRGNYTLPGAAPATCVACEANDKCHDGLVGKDRHNKECAAERLLAGASCVTIRVTTETGSSQTVSKTHTAEATATDEESATAEASAQRKVTATADATAHSTQNATESAQGQVECPGSGIKVRGHKSATATEYAGAEHTAEASAQGEATKSAEAEATAEHEASAKATREVTKDAHAIADGSAEAKRCVPLEEAKKLVKIEGKVGPVLAAKVTTAADKKAFRDAYDAALQEAERTSLANAQDLAKELAGKRAAEEAKLQAEAAANEKAALAAESGAAEKANAAAVASAHATAATKAEVAARKEAEVKAAAAAEEEAARGAKARANDKASAEAKATAEERANAAVDPDKVDPACKEAAEAVVEAPHGAPPEEAEVERPAEEGPPPENMSPADVAAQQP